jgi:Protein of unknown function (DUF1826)
MPLRKSAKLEKPSIIETSARRDLSSIGLPHVKAVILTPAERPWWFDEVLKSVRAGDLHIKKTITDFMTPDTLKLYLSSTLPKRGVSENVREAIKEEMLQLVSICRELTGAKCFQLRYMTAAPDRRFGFHVDLGNSIPTRRVLRVYGEGTQYVDFSNITNMADFYCYVTQRERLARQLFESLKDTQRLEHHHRIRELIALDDSPSFIRDPADIRTVPICSVVAIETVPISCLRPNDITRGNAAGWVHRSPFEGGTRLLIMVTNA